MRGLSSPVGGGTVTRSGRSVTGRAPPTLQRSVNSNIVRHPQFDVNERPALARSRDRIEMIVSLNWTEGSASIRFSPNGSADGWRKTAPLRLLNWLLLPVAWGVLFLIRLYQYLVSPMMPPFCRYRPGCSEYGYRAIRKHGLIRGGALTVRRLLRCHPWGGSGYDPVPDPSDDTDLF